MSKLVSFLSENGFRGIGKCSVEQIEKAEKALNMSFPDEYKEFLAFYQAGSFRGHELMGIETMEYLNVVSNTLFTRENDVSFPKDCFILEDLGIEGLLIIVDKMGAVFTYCNGRVKKESETISGYIETLIN